MQQNNVTNKQKSFSLASVKRQRGASMIGTVLMIAIVLLMIVIAMKVVPAFTEHMSIKNILTTMAEGGKLNEMSKSEIISAFNKRASIDNIQAIKGSDLEVSTNDAGLTVVSVEYQVVRPVMGNVSALIDFSTSSDGK